MAFKLSSAKDKPSKDPMLNLNMQFTPDGGAITFSGVFGHSSASSSAEIVSSSIVHPSKSSSSLTSSVLAVQYQCESLRPATGPGTRCCEAQEEADDDERGGDSPEGFKPAARCRAHTLSTVITLTLSPTKTSLCCSARAPP